MSKNDLERIAGELTAVRENLEFGRGLDVDLENIAVQFETAQTDVHTVTDDELQTLRPALDLIQSELDAIEGIVGE